MFQGGGLPERLGPPSIDEQVELTFECYDETGEGLLTADELPKRLEDLYVGSDVNGDGIGMKELTEFLEADRVSKLLGLDESSGLCGRGPSGADTADRVEEVLELVDDDGNGAIEQGEVSQALWAELSPAISDQSTAISTEALVAFVESLDQERLDAWIAEKVDSILETYDEDGNGSLDASEVPERQWNRLLKAVGDPDTDDNAEIVTRDQLKTYVTDQVSERDLLRGPFDFGGGGRHSGYGWR